MLHRLPKLTHAVAACLLALGALGLGGTAARAYDYCAPCCTYQYVTTYECVTTYVTRCVPYTKVDTLYDHCGCPYLVTRICYREVQVPVVHHIAVTKKVPVYD